MLIIIMLLMPDDYVEVGDVNDDQGITLMTDLIFKASGPRLELSSVSLFDRLKANSIRYRFILGYLVGEQIITIPLYTTG